MVAANGQPDTLILSEHAGSRPSDAARSMLDHEE
jgi:hypothetical protein